MMMDNQDKKFYGKILLFGEYTVLKGSNALTIPHRDYFGQLKFDRSKLNKMNSSNAKDLISLSFYIKDLVKNNEIDFHLDQFRNELEQGLYFSSNIPMGHGLGSSGALSAALYNRYVKNVELCDLGNQLQQELALIESFYHKKSSGLDPLLSFFGRPILLSQKDKSFVEVPSFESFKNLSFFLLDTEQSRQTDKLVDLFCHMDQSGELNQNDLTDLVSSNNRAIDSFLQQNEIDLFEHFKSISKLQLQLFNSMIPIDFAKSWREFLSSNHSALKICGAGGGGFLLGVTKDKNQATELLSPYSLYFMS